MLTAIFFVTEIIVQDKTLISTLSFIFYFNPANSVLDARGKELSARCKLSKVLREIETQ